MADLSKLFVSVAQDKVAGFLNSHLAGYAIPNTAEEGQTSNAVEAKTEETRDKSYDKKIVFLGTSGQIFTQGKLYGGSASEIATLVADVAKLNGADTIEGSVAYAVKAAKEAILGSATVAGKTQTVGAVSDRVAALETLVGDNAADADTVINKLQEVYNWFAGVAETETGKALIESVAANTSAIGTKAVDAQAATGLYKYIDDAVEAANSSADDAIKALDVTGNVSDAIAGITVKVDEADGKVSKPVVTVTGGSVAEGNTSVVTGGTVYTAIKGAVEALDVEETTVKDADSNPLVSFKYSETDGKVSISDLSVTTATLGDYAGMSYDSTTKTWSAANKTDAEIASLNGLVTAADVAAEIVADEKVIATALNDHETRIKAVEGGSLTIAAVTKTDDDSKYVSVTVKTENGSVSDVAVSQTDAVITDGLEVTTAGIVTSTSIANVKAYVDAEVAKKDAADEISASAVTEVTTAGSEVMGIAEGTVASQIAALAAAMGKAQAALAANDHSITTVAQATDGQYVTVTDGAEAGSNDHSYTIGVTTATYDAATDKFTADGLVTSTVLSDVLGDMWETYTEA